jgi:hypothetical protein
VGLVSTYIDISWYWYCHFFFLKIDTSLVLVLAIFKKIDTTLVFLIFGSILILGWYMAVGI